MKIKFSITQSLKEHINGIRTIFFIIISTLILQPYQNCYSFFDIIKKKHFMIA